MSFLAARSKPKIAVANGHHDAAVSCVGNGAREVLLLDDGSDSLPNASCTTPSRTATRGPRRARILSP